MKYTLLLLLLTCSTVHAEPEAPFRNVTCPDPKALAKEILELRVAGADSRFGNNNCLKPNLFPHLKVYRPTYGEAIGDRQPEFVDERRPFELLGVEKADGGLYAVRFKYFLVKGSSVKPVEDKLTYRPYYDETKAHMGCADVRDEPRHWVIKKSCK